MFKLYLLVIAFITKSQTQLPQDLNKLPSVLLEDGNLDDSITQMFNHCKCVIFYSCDEENFIISQEDLNKAKVALNHSLRQIKRLRCSNEYYYCCRNRSDNNIASAAIPSPAFKIRTELTIANCGQGLSSSERIIDEFPWTVAIFAQQTYPRSDYVYKCGGSLIHSKVILTAQHCVRSVTADSLKIILKSEEANAKSSPLKRKVSRIIKHDGYYSGGAHNNIALLILDDSITSVKVICLPSVNHDFVGSRCIATGWQSVNQTANYRIRKVELPVLERQTCQNLLRRTTSASSFTLHSSTLCAGGEEGKDTCKGDGGSPLMCMENGRYVQAGIVSWGLACGQRDVPALYTDVANMRNWIDEELRYENLFV